MRYLVNVTKGNRRINHFETDSSRTAFEKYFDYVEKVADTEICGSYSVWVFDNETGIFLRDLDIVVND